MLKTLSLPNFLSFNSSAKPKPKGFAKLVRTKPVSAFRYWVGMVLVALNFVALMWYVAGVNGNASKGYEIKKLQTKIALLDEQNQQLNLKVSEANSMVAIRTDFLNANFVAVGQATYLQSHPVAINR